jgi:dihydroorotate dehydrogenase (NAD+) catalytic subunit
VTADLSVQVAGVTFRTPVLAASGCFGYAAELADRADLAALGGVVSKGLSLLPRAGNPPWRIAETSAGMLNAIGLENVGVDAFLRDKLPALRRHPVRVIANVFGETVDEYREVCRRLDGAEGLDAVELNLSCPNTEAGGLTFGAYPDLLAQVVRACRKATGLPLWVKLTPNTTDPAELARAAEGEGADALSLINTLVGMAIDAERERPVLANRTGGLSGPAVKPVALAQVYEVAQAVRLPLVGIGGIMSGGDAVEFLLAGASAVQVGTALFLDPNAGARVAQGIGAYLARKGYARVADLVGRALPDGGETRRKALEGGSATP